MYPVNDYSKHYSEESFWKKIQRAALKAGREVVEKALTLYFCLQDPDTPAKAKAVIASALGYLIFPMDAIPDVIFGLGFSDDLAVLVAALAMVATHIKPVHVNKAREKMTQWFEQKPVLTRPK
jgi:uncharacterized membrane protein YkvA (DUF1232 family)